MSLLLTVTATCSALLAARGVSIPTTQSLLNYVLLAAVYGAVLLHRKTPLTVPWRVLLLASFLDVEGITLVSACLVLLSCLPCARVVPAVCSSNWSLIPLISLSSPSHLPLISLSSPFHLPLIALSSPSHLPFISLSSLSHLPLISLSSPSHRSLISLSSSHSSHFTCISVLLAFRFTSLKVCLPAGLLGHPSLIAPCCLSSHSFPPHAAPHPTTLHPSLSSCPRLPFHLIDASHSPGLLGHPSRYAASSALPLHALPRLPCYRRAALHGGPRHAAAV
ncbi:unnamed protein product [Closterium sp. NIES-65]|nr:unnamed protein product [Closterium sp. NIES-65]